MPRFRLILAWLMMAALPLQGWAAASMLYCGPAQRAAVQAQAQVPAAGSDHGMQAAHHGTDAGSPAHHHADTTAADDSDAAGDGADHTCGVCAACCHGVALAQTPHWAAMPPAPGADLAEPLAAVLARASPVPDKPPRA
jgi:hypothetical protein